MKKHRAAYHVHLSAVKNIQRENNGLESMRNPSPAYTNAIGLRNIKSDITAAKNKIS